MKKLLLLWAMCFIICPMIHATVVRETYIYAIKDTDTLRLDTYIDTTLQMEGKRPVFMYVHGGGFTTGSRINVAQEVLLRHMAAQGFVAVAPDYRLAGNDLSNGGKYHVQTLYDIVQIACEDVADAVNYVLAMTDLQPDDSCFVIGGGSAGAITALTLEYDLCNEAAYTNRLPQGFNFAGIISHAGAIDARADSILTWKHAPCPTLFFHGSNDQVVPFERGNVYGDWFVGTKALMSEWQKQGVSNWAFVVPGADHIMAMSPLTENDAETDKFIQQIVQGHQQVNAYTKWTPADVPNMSDAAAMVRFAPLYILGYGKYIEDMDWSNVERPAQVVY